MAPRTVTLRNVATPPRPLVLHLPHADVCAVSGVCLCQTVRAGVPQRGPRGERGLAVVERRVPGTITLLARGTPGNVAEGLPLAVLHAPEVKAYRGKWLEVLVVEGAEPQPEPVSAPPVAAPPTLRPLVLDLLTDPPADEAEGHHDMKEPT